MPVKFWIKQFMLGFDLWAGLKAALLSGNVHMCVLNPCFPAVETELSKIYISLSDNNSF